MRRDSWLVWALGAVVCALAHSASAAPNLTLAANSEDGFRRIIAMAEAGELGEDVSSANVRIEHARVRIELLRPNGRPAVLLLTPKQSGQSPSRYFDVAAGADATRDDAQRLGRALDRAFIEDPFRLTGFEEPPHGEPIPGLGQAWEHGGWRAVVRALQRRMMVLAGLTYTGAVLVMLAVGTLAALLLLWFALPPDAAQGAQSSSARSRI